MVKEIKKIYFANFPKKADVPLDLAAAKNFAREEVNNLYDLLGEEKLRKNLFDSYDDPSSISEYKKGLMKDAIEKYLEKIKGNWKEFLKEIKEGSFSKVSGVMGKKEVGKAEIREKKAKLLETLVHNLRLFKEAKNHEVESDIAEIMATFYQEDPTLIEETLAKLDGDYKEGKLR